MRSRAKSLPRASRTYACVVAALTLALMATGSAAFAAARSESVRSFPLHTLMTFGFRDQRRATADPLESNPIWILDIDLNADGRAEVASPDFYVAFYVEIGDRYDFNIDYRADAADASGRPDRDPRHDASTIPYKTSAVIVDVIDARSNRLVWRGYDSDTFSARDPDKTLERAVHAVMVRFDHDLRSSKP